jgi:site-specific DNA-cytosine methylase
VPLSSSRAQTQFDSDLVKKPSFEVSNQILISHSPSGLTSHHTQEMPTLVTDGRYLMFADKLTESFRYFTPLEWERIQGFPENWTEGFSRRTRYRMLGNSVVPVVAEYLAKGCVSVSGDFLRSKRRPTRKISFSE